MKLLVHSVRLAGEGVLLFELRATDSPLPSWEPGSHIEIEIGPLTRHYSIVRGSRDSWLIAVHLSENGRGGSRILHQQLRPGHVLEVSAPRNNFRLHPGRAVLIAGGIGITPLVSMAEACKEEVAFHAYSHKPENAPLREFLSEDSIVWHNDSLRSAQHFPEPYLPGSHIYMCGPQGFMAKARQLALMAGWPEEVIHQELFAPDRQLLTGEEFSVTAASTGQVMNVKADQTIAEVLQQHGFPVSLSCEMGICGSCLTGVVDGIPDHRDEVQSPSQHEAGNLINVCCSRARTSNLTLEI